MESLMVDGNTMDGLSGHLSRLASDPAQIDTLHSMLGGYCHQCRNTLNSIKLSLYLARRAASPEATALFLALEPHYQAVELLFDRLQTICRPLSLCTVRMPLDLLMNERRRAWAEWFERRGRPLEMRAPSRPAVGDYDPYRLAQGLDALASWRAQVGDPSTPARLGWSAEGDHFLVEWSEEADGHDPRPSGAGPASPDMLALPLLARVIGAHGGTLQADRDEGLQVRLTWPLSLPTSS